MKMIVGLGNPGTRYEKSRHNIGFMVLDAFALSHKLKINKKKCRSLLGQGYIGNEKVLLVKPQTYMNKSGEAVWEILNYYGEGIEDLLIIHDDLDLALGRLRFKRNGGSGGHNGLKSITKMLNSPEYDRLKVGIGRPPEFMPTEAYVLSSFLEKEREVLSEIIKGSLKGLETWCCKGIDEAMNKFNSFNLE
ncbi:MAG: aminoacyl-tRNA hydrolase [Peptococcia bacterium]|jgi:PTH1 family peptidyl-tRNA hydrolase